MKFLLVFPIQPQKKTTIFHPYKYVGEAKAPFHGQS